MFCLPAVLFFAVGVMIAQDNKGVAGLVYDLNLGLVGVAATLLVLRIAHVTYLQIKKPLRYT